eukprot:Gregarina_sp_Poly_1__3073@NODE_1865_length_3165_cov_42_118464_g1210_i0_p5_GENE_NODE_1865_length_3165_cov_42_118464_g1210_i0NODE_1865_length_3165_cov_42_118464_g1210_i0_p5_ORF_typecomplete_len117_score13_60_NODE_1865_length_3165_cov_42_118464_g1210_i020892439
MIVTSPLILHTRQLCVYEAQRLKLQSPEKREQYRVRDTFCVYAFPGFAQDLGYIRIRRIQFEFLEDHPPIAHIFHPIRFRVLAGDEIDFQNLWQLNCVFESAVGLWGDRADMEEEL